MVRIREMLRLEALERTSAQLQSALASVQAELAALARTRPVQAPERALPAPLHAINAARQARCNALRAALASVLAQVPHPASITAKEVAQALARAGFEPMPRARTVRLRLAEVRAEMATHGNTGNCQKSA